MSPKASSKEASPKEGDAKAKPEKAKGEKSKPRLKEKYVKEVLPVLLKEFGYSNVMQVPRLEKVVVSIGLGEAIQNANKGKSEAELAVLYKKYGIA